jgi:hypothetical protein
MWPQLRIDEMGMEHRMQILTVALFRNTCIEHCTCSPVPRCQNRSKRINSSSNHWTECRVFGLIGRDRASKAGLEIESRVQSSNNAYIDHVLGRMEHTNIDRCHARHLAVRQ